jgi:tetratricopeptide (TPR) repeat protein
MKKEEDNLLIKIDAFLKGHLSKEETAAFAQEIAEDTALSQRVAQQRVHLQALDLLLADDLRAKMNNWETEADTYTDVDTGKKPLNGWTIVGLSLGALTLLMLLYFLWIPQNKAAMPANQQASQHDSLNIKQNDILKNNKDTLQKTPNSTIKPQKQTPSVLDTKLDTKKSVVEAQTLPKDFFITAHEDLAVVLTELENNQVRRGKEADTLIVESYRLIQQKYYVTALNTLKNAQNTEGVFARAIAYFFVGQYLEALPLFDSVAKDSGFAYAETADYYAALCLLADGQKQKAVEHLTKIAQDKGHAYSSKAQFVIQ